MISRQYKTIFIHIHKTAGSSIEKKLGLFDEIYRGAQDHRKISDYESILTKSKISLMKDSFYSFKKRDFKGGLRSLNHIMNPELTIDEYNSFFKFTIVRNSWSRIYSWYMNVMRDDIHKKSMKITDNISLEHFISEKINSKSFNQLSFITNSEGNIPLNFIGRFENLENDFYFICKELGIKDYTLPEILISNNDHYSKFYNNRTKDLVYKNYKEEIDYFKFQFGE